MKPLDCMNGFPLFTSEDFGPGSLLPQNVPLTFFFFQYNLFPGGRLSIASPTQEYITLLEEFSRF